MEKLAAILIASHIVVDFLLQPDDWVRRKDQPAYLLLHVTLHAALTYVILQVWTCWQAPAFIFVAHALIDLFTQRLAKDSAKSFVMDQALHVFSLLVLTWLLTRVAGLETFTGIGYRLFIVVAGS